MSVSVEYPLSVQIDMMSLTVNHSNSGLGSPNLCRFAECGRKSAERTILSRKTPNGSPTDAALPMAPRELAARMERPNAFLLLDCRSFISFNSNHIIGALNLCCADRFSRKRLQNGKLGLVDLINGDEEKHEFREKFATEVVLYDETTSDLSNITPTHPMYLVLSALNKHGKKGAVLIGGLQGFQSKFSHLCVKPSEHALPQQLYSPTTPVVEPDIDTATADAVLPFLFLGNARDAACKERLKELKITHILNVTANIPDHFESEGIIYKRLNASDSGHQNLAQFFQTAFQFIESARQANGRVLLHCQAGISRSATITIAYIMQHSSLNMMDAFQYVKIKRAIIAPNFNFMGQLMQFEEQLINGTITRDSTLNIQRPCAL